MRRGWGYTRTFSLLILAFMFSGCIAPLPGLPGSGGDDNGGGIRPGTVVKLELPITDPKDDGWRDGSTNPAGILTNAPVIWFGGAPGAYQASGFFRWQKVQIPQGAKILEAKVLVKHIPNSDPGLNKWDTRIDIRGFKADNLGSFNPAVDTNTLPRTEAMVPWDLVDEVWSLTESDWHETPDIREVIEEIVNRPGWRAGNALGIGFDARSDDDRGLQYNREIYPREAGQDVAPILLVRYTL